MHPKGQEIGEKKGKKWLLGVAAPGTLGVPPVSQMEEWEQPQGGQLGVPPLPGPKFQPPFSP